MSQEDWSSWVEEQCHDNGWTHPPSISPLIWRELIDRGGKGAYVGSLSEFEEYTQHYYGISPSTTVEMDAKISAENLDAFHSLQLEKGRNIPSKPLHVCITQASSPLAYQLAPLLLSKKVFGDRKIHLHLYDTQDKQEILQGVSMELYDMAHPLLAGVTCTDSVQEAFREISALYILDYYNDSSTGTNEELSEIAQRYSKYAGILDYSADKDVRVVLIGPYSNTGAGIMSKFVSSIDRKNFISSSSLAEHQASTILATKMNTTTADVTHVGILGRSQGEVIADTGHVLVKNFQGSVVGPNDFSINLSQCLFDNKWVKDDFPMLFSKRHTNSGCYGNQGLCLAEAVVLCKLMKSWCDGDEMWHSVGTVHEEDQDVVVSYPCICKDGKWERVSGIDIGEEVKEALETVVVKLKDKLKEAFSFINKEQDSDTTPSSKL